MRVLVVIPLYNEEDSIVRVLDEVRRHAPADILVVDDGSTDRSPEILGNASGITLLCHEQNQGYGACLIRGFGHAVGRDYDAVVTIDADDQHEPALIPALVAELARTDIVSGSRYLAGSERGDEAPRDRMRINQLVTARICEVTGYSLTDAFCGFKAYRTSALAKLELDEPSYGMPLQMWIQAARRGLSVCEVAVGRIYPTPDRHFGGNLDRPCARLKYYVEVMRKEMRRWPRPCSS
jgi:glycosyltransferase involved in cell wall biosynthesis